MSEWHVEDELWQDAEHTYFSTACLHGLHAYCAADVRDDGMPKMPAACKFCLVKCICGCHEPVVVSV